MCEEGAVTRVVGMYPMVMCTTKVTTTIIRGRRSIGNRSRTGSRPTRARYRPAR
jgi:hypothetical protein